MRPVSYSIGKQPCIKFMTVTKDSRFIAKLLLDMVEMNWDKMFEQVRMRIRQLYKDIRFE